MFNHLETQTVPADSRRRWVKPELRSLDLKETLHGGLKQLGEYGFYDNSGDTWGIPCETDPTHPNCLPPVFS